MPSPVPPRVSTQYRGHSLSARNLKNVTSPKDVEVAKARAARALRSSQLEVQGTKTPKGNVMFMFSPPPEDAKRSLPVFKDDDFADDAGDATVTATGSIASEAHVAPLQEPMNIAAMDIIVGDDEHKEDPISSSLEEAVVFGENSFGEPCNAPRSSQNWSTLQTLDAINRLWVFAHEHQRALEDLDKLSEEVKSVSSDIAFDPPLAVQGNIEFYSFENQKIRRELKHDAQIQDLISLLWSIQIASHQTPITDEVAAARNVASEARRASFEAQERVASLRTSKDSGGTRMAVGGDKLCVSDAAAIEAVSAMAESEAAAAAATADAAQAACARAEAAARVDYLRDGVTIGKAEFCTWLYKLHFLMTPPPIDKQAARSNALMDWARDARGRREMTYELFEDGVFQLVDIWAESCNAEEYVEILARIVRGVTRPECGGASADALAIDSGLDALPTLVWKDDDEIVFDELFADEKDSDERMFNEDDREAFDDVNSDLTIDDNNVEGDAVCKLNRISRLYGMVMRQHHVALMSVSRVCGTIADIYAEYVRQNLVAVQNQAKQQSQLAIVARKASKASVAAATVKIDGEDAKARTNRLMLLSRIGLELHTKRFDSFIIAFFRGRFGLKKIANKMLRNFVASVQAHRARSPRVETFAGLSGLKTQRTGRPAQFTGLRPYRFGEYVRPILRVLFTAKGVPIGKALGRGVQPVLVPHSDFLVAALKPLVHVPVRHPSRTNFQMALTRLCSTATAETRAQAGKALDGRHARMVVDVDMALVLLEPLWEVEDEYRKAKFTIRNVLRVQRQARKWLAITCRNRGTRDGAPTSSSGVPIAVKRIEEARELDHAVDTAAEEELRQGN